ncbi:MAG: branched-chain amino acid transport system permease protein [Actinomycetota bacterium]|jgi:branched-chain amino acid transport system permease protein
MRRVWVVCALVAVLWPGAASAEGAPRQAWAQTGVVPTFAPATGRLYVAAAAGTEAARTFVQLDGTTGPATLTVAEVGAESALADTATIGACPLTLPLGTGDAPTADCTVAAPMARAADGTWSLSLEAWPEHGVAIAPILSTTSTFTLALDPAKTTVAATGAPAPAAADESVVPVAAEAVAVETGSYELPASPVIAAPAATAPAAEPSLPTRATRAVAAGAARVLSAASPSAAVVLPVVALLALGLVWLLRRPPANSPALRSGPAVKRASSLGLGGAAAVVLLPLLLGEASVYKLGLVLIVVAGAIGLHLLVNWAGELSLAHATLVGLPAFVVAKLSADHDLSPVYLLPVAIGVGLVAGAVVGMPALRARGLQVALVTLAAGVAIDRFFFTRTWVVGPSGGSQVSTPRLGPVTFTTAKSMYPLLALLVLASGAAAWMIHRSRLGRGLLWVKAQPDAAAAFGVPVARYRAVAYALAGAYAGFAGGLTAMWVQRLTPEAFPLSRSFTYLIIVALAGRGFVGGVAAAATAIEGGRLFLASSDALITYGAPLGLIFTLTRHPAGLNGAGRQLVAFAKERTMQHAIRPLVAVGAVVIAVGFGAIGLAWYHAGNTSQVWVQNQELISGGIGGLALVIVGVTLIAYDRVSALIAAMRQA